MANRSRRRADCTTTPCFGFAGWDSESRFVADLGVSSGNRAIVRAALGLARELGIEVVVEGVETAAQLELLKGWGCRNVQGYYFAKPLPASDVIALMRIGTISPVSVELADIAVLV